MFFNFHMNKCSSSHEQGNKSQCKRMLFCPNCRVKLYKFKREGTSQDKHTCDESFCKNCQVMYHPEEEEEMYKYYMRSILALMDDKLLSHQFIFYDFESMLMTLGDHVPILVIAQSIWDNCSEVTRLDSTSTFDICGSQCEE